MSENSGTTVEGGQYYIYGLLDPIRHRQVGGNPLLSVYYVGKGKKDRVGQHEKDQRAALEQELSLLPMGGSKAARIQNLLDRGEDIPSITLASGFHSEEDAYRAEALTMELVNVLLDTYGQPRLSNAIPGHGQSRGMPVSSSEFAVPRPYTGEPPNLAEPDPTRGPVGDPTAQQGPKMTWRSVSEMLKAATSVPHFWSDLDCGSAILVKGTREAMLSGEHPRLDGAALPAAVAGRADRVAVREAGFVPDSTFERRGYDPDDPWTDAEARDRARRYWPIDSATVAGWLDDPSSAPPDVLLAIPGTGGRTTVRYLWRLDVSGEFEYYPELRRWGLFPDEGVAHVARRAGASVAG